METSVITLAAFLAQAPTFTMWVIGFVLAVKLRPHNPKKAQLIMAAMAIFILHAMFDTVLNIILPRMMGYETMGWVFGIKGFFSAIIMAIGWMFVLWALFNPSRDTTIRDN